MSTTEKAEFSFAFTVSIILLPFGVIIIISSTKMLTTGLSRSALVIKTLWSALVCFKPSLSRKKFASLLYQRCGDCLRLYKAFRSLHIISWFALVSIHFDIYLDELVAEPVEKSRFDIHLVNVEIKESRYRKKNSECHGFYYGGKDLIKVNSKLLEVAFYHPPSLEASDIVIYVTFQLVYPLSY